MTDLKKFKLIDLIIFWLLIALFGKLLLQSSDYENRRLYIVICLGFLYLGNAIKYSNLLILNLSHKQQSEKKRRSDGGN